MIAGEAVEAPITDAEYALIRQHLPAGMVDVFDGLKSSGQRLGEAVEDKPRYIRAWVRAVEQAKRDGLTRRPRIHDLRVEFIRRAYEARRQHERGYDPPRCPC